MAILYPKGWVEPTVEKPAVSIEAVKAQIKEFVTSPKYYDEIIKEVQRTNFITNDEVQKLIEEVKSEWEADVVVGELGEVEAIKGR